jgi:hypothetical protein
LDIRKNFKMSFLPHDLEPWITTLNRCSNSGLSTTGSTEYFMWLNFVYHNAWYLYVSFQLFDGSTKWFHKIDRQKIKVLWRHDIVLDILWQLCSGRSVIVHYKVATESPIQSRDRHSITISNSISLTVITFCLFDIFVNESLPKNFIIIREYLEYFTNTRDRRKSFRIQIQKYFLPYIVYRI